MGIVNGYIKTKRYRKQTDGNYILQSELTRPESVEWEDGTTLATKIISHPQSASDITGGTLGGQVVAPAEADYDTNRMRNMVFLPKDNDPGANVATSYSNGSMICLYE